MPVTASQVAPLWLAVPFFASSVCMLFYGSRILRALLQGQKRIQDQILAYLPFLKAFQSERANTFSERYHRVFLTVWFYVLAVLLLLGSVMIPLRRSGL